MFRCPVCHHATLSFKQELVSPFRAIECSSCHSELHQAPFGWWRSLLVALPFAAMLLPRRIGMLQTPLIDVLTLLLCVIVSLAVAFRLGRLEPVAPPATKG